MKACISKHGIVVLALFSILACFPCQSFALQGRAPSGPIGGTDINQALVPPPGLYGGLIYGYMDFSAWVDDDGNETDAGDAATIAAVAFAYSWDTTIFGGSVLSSISLGWQDQDWWVGDNSLNDHFSGIIDIYSDLFFWSRFFPSQAFETQPKGSVIPYGLAVGCGLGVTLPTGTYDESDVNSVGSNIYTIAPSIALTYTMPSLFGDFLGDATQFSARFFYNNYTDQKHLKYRNGDILNTDYAITQITGDWQYGIAGSYYTQISGDKFLDGTTGDANRTMMWSIGPVVNYNFSVGEHPFSAKFKSCFFLDGKNTAKSNIFFLSIGTPF
jgi:hypothetical protein